MRLPASGPRHAIAAGHPLAAAAGFAVLEGGGNAVDAGVAAGMALGVLVPDLVNVGGVAPILIRLADGRAESIAGLGWWPAATPPEVFLREHGGAIPQGVRRTVIAAAPDAWITALERHGTLRFEEAARYAIRWAEEGFAVPPLLAEGIAAHRADYARWPSNATIFLPGGAPPAPGARFVQADLARTLRFMADESARHLDRLEGLAAARHAFYRGDIARIMTRFVEEEGGWLSMADLAGFRSPIEPVIRTRWRGLEVLACALVPRPRPAAGPEHRRGGGPRRPRARQRRFAAPHRGDHQARLRRPRALLRRPALRGRAAGPHPVRAERPQPRRANPHGQGAALRRAGAIRHAPGAGPRHLLCRRGGPLGQRLQRHAVRRLL